MEKNEWFLGVRDGVCKKKSKNINQEADLITIIFKISLKKRRKIKIW